MSAGGTSPTASTATPPARGIRAHRNALLACRRCPRVVPPVVAGPALRSRIYLLGQAPGVHEGEIGRPFAWTAGKTLFRWFEGLGVAEETFRKKVYMAAVLRCFPGKGAGSGDRVPSRAEIERCRSWIAAEQQILRPELVIAVGRLGIEQVMSSRPRCLEDVVGGVARTEFHGREIEWVALPHPSGLSSWHKTEPGRTLLGRALDALGRHPTWKNTFG